MAVVWQGMVLLNPEELVLPPVRIPEDMLPHEKARHLSCQKSCTPRCPPLQIRALD